MAVLCVVSTLALAGEMTCAKDGGIHCIMAKNAKGDEVEVLVFKVKVGDTLTCTPQGDLMLCQQDPMKPQNDAMQKQ